MINLVDKIMNVTITHKIKPMNNHQTLKSQKINHISIPKKLIKHNISLDYHKDNSQIQIKKVIKETERYMEALSSLNKKTHLLKPKYVPITWE